MKERTSRSLIMGFVVGLLLVVTVAVGLVFVRSGRGQSAGPEAWAVPNPRIKPRPAPPPAPALSTQPQDATVVARFGNQWTPVPLDPSPELRALIYDSVDRWREEDMIGVWPKIDPSSGFRFDLDGDGHDEYFIGVGSGVTGNINWAIFADRPARYLDEAFGAHVFIHARTGQWSPITSWVRMGADQAIVTRLVIGEGTREQLIEDPSADGRPFLRRMGMPPCGRAGSRPLDVSERNCHAD